MSDVRCDRRRPTTHDRRTTEDDRSRPTTAGRRPMTDNDGQRPTTRHRRTTDVDRRWPTTDRRRPLSGPRRHAARPIFAQPWAGARLGVEGGVDVGPAQDAGLEGLQALGEAPEVLSHLAEARARLRRYPGGALAEHSRCRAGAHFLLGNSLRLDAETGCEACRRRHNAVSSEHREPVPPCAPRRKAEPTRRPAILWAVSLVQAKTAAPAGRVQFFRDEVRPPARPRQGARPSATNRVPATAPGHWGRARGGGPHAPPKSGQRCTPDPT